MTNRSSVRRAGGCSANTVAFARSGARDPSRAPSALCGTGAQAMAPEGIRPSAPSGATTPWSRQPLIRYAASGFDQTRAGRWPSGKISLMQVYAITSSHGRLPRRSYGRSSRTSLIGKTFCGWCRSNSTSGPCRRIKESGPGRFMLREVASVLPLFRPEVRRSFATRQRARAGEGGRAAPTKQYVVPPPRAAVHSTGRP
jgi:hypothetical protein